MNLSNFTMMINEVTSVTVKRFNVGEGMHITVRNKDGDHATISVPGSIEYYDEYTPESLRRQAD